jgi:hypothetical protein
MQAITFTTPVHSLQVLMSILQTRLRRFAQVIDARTERNRTTPSGRSTYTPSRNNVQVDVEVEVERTTEALD